ncbi:MAG: hypothetical protein IJK90_08220 [Bacteroidales bacterium]|nr:hypothetical protein [Bacteroidales bacterium]
MKRLYLIFSLLLACLSSYGRLEAAPTAAAPDTLERYLIDRQEVRQFDGSQLVGKKIVSYQITTVYSDNETVRVHEILTENAPSRPADPAYVIDGRQVTKEEFEKLSPSGIKSLVVIKNGSREDVKQYAGWENGVILITTKGDGQVSASTVKSDSLKVFIRGKDTGAK